MAEGEIPPRIVSIKRKLDQLRENHATLKAENANLSERNAELEAKLREVSEEKRVLQKDYDRIKLAKTLVSSTGDKAEMKFRVNEMVREIDKCIALLNR
jgi:predicted nuclease with TOPRIM domain